MGCRVLIHEPAKTITSWGFHAMPGCYVGPALHHYLCFTVFPAKTRSIIHCDTVEFRHEFVTVPAVTPEDKVVNAISKLEQELAIIPSPSSLNQLNAIEKLQTMFSKHKTLNRLPPLINTMTKSTQIHQLYSVKKS